MKYIKALENVCSQNDKIITLQVLKKLSLPHERSKIITTEAFRQYRDGGFKNLVKNELETVSQEYLNQGEVCIRTAYFSPQKSDVLMPRSTSLTSQKQCLAFIRKVWDFFIENKMHGPQVENNLIIENFGPRFASGTFVTSRVQRRSICFIEVIYGIWEGIQGNIHDVYTVDLKDKKILYKDVPKKEKAFFPIAAGKWEYKKVPEELATRQIMPDEQILGLVAYASIIEKNFGPKQVEFFILYDGGEILLWHITNPPQIRSTLRYFGVLSLLEKAPANAKIIFQGKLARIEKINQVKEIKPTDDTILFIDSEIIAKRDPLLINLIGKFAAYHNLPVLYKGGILSHVFTVLSEFGVLIFPVNESVEGLTNVRIFQKEVSYA